MRFNAAREGIGAMIVAASILILAGAAVAQQPGQNPPPPPPPGQSDQSQQQGPVVRGGGPDTQGPFIIGRGMRPPGATQFMAQMPGQGPGRRGSGGRGPGGDDHGIGSALQRISRLLAALDDPRVRTVLGLTDQQADGLRKIVVDTETFTIKTSADIAVNSIEVRELLRANKPDKSAVMAKGDVISKDTSQLINHYLSAMLDAKAILTPEQQKKIREYMENGGPAFPPAGTIQVQPAPIRP